MSELSAQNLTERQREIFGGETTVGPRDAWQTSRNPIQSRPKFDFRVWIKSRKIRWWYVVIGAVDMGIGAVSFGASGHFLIIQMILGAFGMAATIGRVQAFRHAQSLKGKTEKTVVSKRRLFYFAWGVGIFLATYFGLHFENAIVKAQSTATAITNAKAQNQEHLVNELADIAKRRPGYDRGLNDAVASQSWNTRDTYRDLIRTDNDRAEKIQHILDSESVIIAVSAKEMFGGIAGINLGQVMALIGFLGLHLFMELMLALFSSPLVINQTQNIPTSNRPRKRQKRRGKSPPDESII